MTDHKTEHIKDSMTQTTDISYQTQRIQHPPFLNKIIESTEQIINNQAMKIFQLSNQIKTMKRQNQVLKLKYETLMKMLNLKQEDVKQQKQRIKNTQNKDKGQNNQNNQTQHKSNKLIDELIEKVGMLQTDLITAKMQLAQCKAQNLQLKFTSMKNHKSPTSISSSFQLIKFHQVQKLKTTLILQSKFQKIQQPQNLIEWNKLTQTFLLGYPRIGKFKQKTFQLIKKGIPNSLRQTLWPIIFENKVGITNVLYSQLLNRKQKDQNYTKRVLSQINKDICRSFNGKTQFDSKIGLSTQVTQILQVFHIYRPDVSYVQGMTYPVIVLNLIVGKYKAFSIFSNLILGNQFFRRLYTFQTNYLTCYCRTFDVLLQQKLPKVAKYLIQKSIQSQIYLVQWFYTFFSRGLSYQFTLKIWDYLAYQGQLLFYKLGLAIFQLLQLTLIQYDQEPISVIRQFSSYITQPKLQQTLFSQKLTYDKLQKTFDKIFKKQ